jgi:hypothetical protein
MIGKATLEDLPKTKKVITKPLYQINMDSFSSSVKSIEGYFYSLVFVDAATGYRWIYGLKTKGEALNVVKRWYADIADLRAKHKLVVLMRDNAGEYKSEEIMKFLDSKGVRSHFSTPKELWQNGSAEATIYSIMMSARTVMVESGLGCRFWFRAATAGKDTCNVMVPYNKLHVSNYRKVHYDQMSDVVVLKVESQKNTFTRAIWSKYLADSNELLRIWDKKNNPIHAHFAGVTHQTLHQTLRGLDPRINPDKQPRNFRDAMKALDKQAWAAAYNSEFVGFKQRKVFKVVRPDPGVKIHDMLTRLEYKEDSCEFVMNKVHLCSRGDQQISGVSFQESDLYAPVLKEGEARLLLALAGANGAKVVKTNTKQAYLYCNMGDDMVYILPADWWPEPVPEGHVFRLLRVKSIYGMRQAARKWHTHISTWMEQNGYSAVYSEKTIFMKHKDDEYIIHGLFVDDMMHIYSCDAVKVGFLALYEKDFNITGGTKMETFLGMVVEQSDKLMKIHLDNYVKDVVAEYAEYIKKALRPKKVPISPGVAFKAEDVPELPDPLKQKYYRSFVAKLQFFCNMDPVRYFVRGIAVGTILLICWYSSYYSYYSSMGSAPPSGGISFLPVQLQDRLSQRHEAS